MPTATYEITATAYTEIAEGPRSVRVDPRTVGQARIAQGPSLPAVDTNSYITVDLSRDAQVFSLQPGEKLWARMVVSVGQIVVSDYSVMGTVGGITPRVQGTITVPADTNAFAVGDLIGNSLTASAVQPIVFALPRPSGILTGARAAVSVATGVPVVANLAFDLLLYRSQIDVPFAAAAYPASNAPLSWPATAPGNEAARLAMTEMVAVFSFTGGAQAVQRGSGWQSIGAAVFQRGLLSQEVSHAPFNVHGRPVQQLVGLLMARGAWNNGNAAHRIDITLDVAAD